jgi:hypothetical protein
MKESNGERTLFKISADVAAGEFQARLKRLKAVGPPESAPVHVLDTFRPESFRGAPYLASSVGALDPP